MLPASLIYCFRETASVYNSSGVFTVNFYRITYHFDCIMSKNRYYPDGSKTYVCIIKKVHLIQSFIAYA